MLKPALWLCAGLFIVLTGVARGDEVWDSTFGRVIYQEDVGVDAVWTYRVDGSRGVIHILGLAGIYENRGSYDGYWAQEEADRECNTLRIGVDGKPTHYWGRFRITFIDPAFPARWAARWGYCDDEPSGEWNGKPVQ